MIACARTECPPLLAKHGETIGKDYVQNRKTNPSHVFQWPRRDGYSLYDIVRDSLQKMTCDHCAYCDGSPLGATSIPTVDHFRPKGLPEFHHLVCDWSNLYLCCSRCNHDKGEKWNEVLLSPDAPDYDFSIISPPELIQGNSPLILQLQKRTKCEQRSP